MNSLNHSLDTLSEKDGEVKSLKQTLSQNKQVLLEKDAYIFKLEAKSQALEEIKNELRSK